MDGDLRVVGEQTRMSGIQQASSANEDDLLLVSRSGVGHSSTLKALASLSQSSLYPAYDIKSADRYWIIGKQFYKEFDSKTSHSRIEANTWLHQNYPWIQFRDLEEDRLFFFFKKYSQVCSISNNTYLSESKKVCFNGIFMSLDSNADLYAKPGDILSIIKGQMPYINIYPVLPHVQTEGDPS